ncbi:MAG TPA: phosphatase PAP2 family protein [Rudaea sp.]|nr:phosphatase PAP2 family protein [Rudaea sp.]
MRSTALPLFCLLVWSCSAFAQFRDEAPQPQFQPMPLAADGEGGSGASSGPESPISFTYLDLLWADTKETVTAPLHWDGDEWRTAGLVGGGLLVTMAVLDRPIRDAAQRGRSKGSDDFFVKIERFGTKQYELPVAVGFYAYGAFANDYEAKATALDGFSASVIASLATSAIKGIVGRARPNTGLGPHHFSPFRGDYSFPSGHATGAFAFASVIAAHYDSPWVDATAYGVASLVGIARIRLDAHWTSDVIAGGLIGGLIGHHLVEFNRRWRAEHESAWVPTLETDGQQVVLAWRY